MKSKKNNNINLGFWGEIKKPILALAPMADVTDEAFRQMFVKYGKPDVLFTEFVSVNGLCSEKGYKNMLLDLKFKKNEHPIVAQVFGSDPEKFYQAAKIIKKLRFDGIDINMGCPDKKVEKQGAGAALMKNPKLAQEIIKETKRGAGSMPVSVKTRIGYNKIETTKWIKALLEAEPAAISIHWRTRKEMSEAKAHWSEAKKVMKLAKNKKTLIIGNGDVESMEDAYAKAEKYGVDGIMVGRGVFGQPWFFAHPSPPSPSPTGRGGDDVEKKLKIMLEHAVLFNKLFHGRKNFAIMKKHFKAYANGFKGAKELRVKLMKADNIKDVKRVVKEFTI
ncbi:MAG: tRNA-dihydrouridine synthase [Patescibacteria group bacterium]|jgi:nifR3 family TIM-barrel protein